MKKKQQKQATPPKTTHKINQLSTDDEIEDMYDAILQRIIKNRKKVSAPRKDKGKRKKKVQYWSIGNSGGSRKGSKDTKTFGTEFGMQMIADRFGDGWQQSITIFGGQQIAALFGNAVT